MEKKRFNVKVKTGYDDVSFGFDELEEAMRFAETALDSAVPYVNSNNNEEEVVVKISMENFEMKKKVLK